MSAQTVPTGGRFRTFLPQGLEDKVEKLLGKRGIVGDRHSLSGEDLMAKFESARRRLSVRYCSWDECLGLYQWIMRGVVGYVPLVGIPPAVSLHDEDASFQRQPWGFDRRQSGFAVAIQDGGLGAPSAVESVVASVASDLILLLSGVSTASPVARDSLRYAMALFERQLRQMG